MNYHITGPAKYKLAHIYKSEAYVVNYDSFNDYYGNHYAPDDLVYSTMILID